MTRLLFIFGTRPEAIKIAPICQLLRKRLGEETKICVTAQHRQMLDQVLSIFRLQPDYDLNLMQENQSLVELTSNGLRSLHALMQQVKPARVVVHGDTTTTLIASLAAYYLQIPVAHVEAGLRSHKPYAPWPEEMNRALCDRISNLHFAPTPEAKDNLLAEGISEKNIFVTGNTAVDAILETIDYLGKETDLREGLQQKYQHIRKPFLLLTCHRRESFGDKLLAIFQAMQQIQEQTGFDIVYPVHPNPNVAAVAKRTLGHLPGFHLIPPVDYLNFIYLLQQCHLVLTDSGGIQEESPTLNKPVLVLRDETERPELLACGAGLLVGTNTSNITQQALRILQDRKLYEQMAAAPNPYGDGKAAQRICQVLMDTVSTQTPQTTDL